MAAGIRKWIEPFRARAAEFDFLVLVVICVVVGGVWAFVELADEVIEGETEAIDRWMLLSMREAGDLADPVGPVWFEEAVRDITALGSTAVLTLATVFVLGYLCISRKFHAALFVLAAAGGGTLLTIAMKAFFARPRPDFVPALTEVGTASFPSGHAQLSATIYLTLGVLLARLAPGVRRRLYIIGAAIVLTFIVGLSRIYLGVHYPSDVLGGWTAGIAWALACWLAARALQRRHLVEPAPDDTQARD